MRMCVVCVCVRGFKLGSLAQASRGPRQANAIRCSYIKWSMWGSLLHHFNILSSAALLFRYCQT